MFKKFYYITSLTLVFIIPSLISGYFISDYINFFSLAVFVLTITISGALWDLWASRHGKNDPVWLWMFNKNDTLGIQFLGLPIEEYLFYVFSSVYVIFLWEIIQLTTIGVTHLAYYLIPSLLLWTLLSVAIPYKFSPENDRMVG
jgi:lycopene cyclase domain-containing protein